MKICATSFLMKNVLLHEKKPDIGNGVEPSAQYFWPEGSTQGFSIQHFRSNLQVIYQVRGKATTWACGIIHALGMVNFLFDSSQTPHIAARGIWEYFELSSSTMQAKSKQIRDLLGMYPMDPDWSIPSMIDKNPLVWMLEVNGLIIDVRHAPRELQEAAFRKGLIPYLPDA